MKTGFRGGFFVRSHEMDLLTGLRELDREGYVPPKKTFANLPHRIFGGLF